MPTYEYQCSKCGVFEVSQRITEDALTKCPTCKRKVQRLISAANFAFKGSGWYVTDYARKGKGTDKGGEASSSNGGDGGKGEKSSTGDTKSESKPSTPAPSSGGSSDK